MQIITCYCDDCYQEVPLDGHRPVDRFHFCKPCEKKRLEQSLVDSPPMRLCPECNEQGFKAEYQQGRIFSNDRRDLDYIACNHEKFRADIAAGKG